MTLLVDTLRTEEAAKALGVDPKTVRSLADRACSVSCRLRLLSARLPGELFDVIAV